MLRRTASDSPGQSAGFFRVCRVYLVEKESAARSATPARPVSPASLGSMAQRATTASLGVLATKATPAVQAPQERLVQQPLCALPAGPLSACGRSLRLLGRCMSVLFPPRFAACTDVCAQRSAAQRSTAFAWRRAQAPSSRGCGHVARGVVNVRVVPLPCACRGAWPSGHPGGTRQPWPARPERAGGA